MTNLVEFTVGGKTARSTKTGHHVLSVDFDALPDASKAFIIRYGLSQYCGDGGAGAETPDEFKAGAQKKLAKVLAGDFTRQRGEGNGPTDSVEVLAKKLAKDIVLGLIKTNNVEVTKEQKAEAVAAYFAANEAKFRKEAEKQIADRKAAAAANGAAILASLGLAPKAAEAEVEA